MALNALMVLDTDPIIIHGITWKHVFNPMWSFGPLLKGQRVNFLASLSWSLLDKERAKRTLIHHEMYRQEFPEHHVTMLCNELPEKIVLAKYGIDAHATSLNALLDYRLYRPMEAEKCYDAVINSRLDRWKRHILAKKIPRLSVITYGYLKSREEETYLKYLRHRFTRADFPNYDAQGVYHWLQAEEVANVYGQSHTGLILSAVEGGCFAAVEYLLSGLPVVSTENIGGRNLFLHPDFSCIVPATQDAVHDAVMELQARRLDPNAIREATIERMEFFRQKFLDAWQAIYTREGVKKDAREQWERLYINKMIVPLKNHEVAPYLQSQGIEITGQQRIEEQVA